MNTYSMESFTFFIFIKFAKMLKTYFCFRIMVYGVQIDVEKCNLKQFNIRHHNKKGVWILSQGTVCFSPSARLFSVDESQSLRGLLWSNHLVLAMTTFVASAHLLYAGMTGAIQNAVNKSPLKKKKTGMLQLFLFYRYYNTKFWKKFLYSGPIDVTV